MNKKGFTLIELLGVVIIMIALSLLVIPNIVNRFSNKKDDISKVDNELIISAAKMYKDDHEDELKEYNTYCIDINTLIDNNYLSDSNKENYKKIYRDSKYVVQMNSSSYEVIEKTSCQNESIYKSGYRIKVNGMDFYTLFNYDDYVVALKADPLTVDEVNKYGLGNVNNYATYDSVAYQTIPVGEACDYFRDGSVGGMAYYSSSNCGYPTYQLSLYDCKRAEYDISNVKTVVDEWAKDKLDSTTLKTVDGYSARLIKINELEKLKYVKLNWKNVYPVNENVPKWLYDGGYLWWTMTKEPGYDKAIYTVCGNRQHCPYYGGITSYMVYAWNVAVRPVINVYKSAIQFE